MANIGTKLFTSFFGKLVGEDEFGNKYFKSKPSIGKYVGRYNKERRWVIFNGKSEPSKIPPHWHGWIHYSFDEPPEKKASKAHSWQKEHTPNLTGTELAYLPPGHKNKKGNRDKANGDYEAWQPK